MGWPIALAAASGLLSFVADWPPSGLVFLQLVALVPWLVAARDRTAREHVLLACVLGLAFTIPRAIVVHGLSLAVPHAIALAVYVGALHVAWGLAAFGAGRLRPALGAVALAGALATIGWLDSLLPMWGTGQSMARPWVAHPSFIRCVATFGVPGFTFVVVAAQALAVAWARSRTRGPIVALAGILAVVASLDCLAPSARSAPHPAVSGTLRVAAIGWANDDASATFDDLVARASAAGARLVVSPEAVVDVARGERAAFESRFGELARRHGVHLAVGYLDGDRNENRLAFFGPTGALEGDYAKTHPVPLERSRAGDGRIVVVDVDGVRVGGMICHDDDFSDLARAYAAARVEIVVVPTYEWSPWVAPYHAQNDALRTVEARYAVVRAVARGTSAVVAPDGVVLGSRDHLREGTGIVIADIPVRRASVAESNAHDGS
jgi:apolipoprotein N-acyltransferase